MVGFAEFSDIAGKRKGETHHARSLSLANSQTLNPRSPRCFAAESGRVQHHLLPDADPCRDDIVMATASAIVIVARAVHILLAESV